MKIVLLGLLVSAILLCLHRNTKKNKVSLNLKSLSYPVKSKAKNSGKII